MTINAVGLRHPSHLVPACALKVFRQIFPRERGRARRWITIFPSPIFPLAFHSSFGQHTSDAFLWFGVVFSTHRLPMDVFLSNVLGLSSTASRGPTGRCSRNEIENAILQELRSYTYPDEINPQDVDLPSEVETIAVTFVEDISDLLVEEVRKLSLGDWFIDATIRASYVFDFFIFKSDWYAMDENVAVDIMNDDWNDHYVLAQAERKVEVSLALKFNDQTGSVTGLEVKGFVPCSLHS